MKSPDPQIRIYFPPPRRRPHWTIRAIPYVLAFTALCGVALSFVLFYLFMSTIK